MKPSPRAVAFDLDGTLLDSVPLLFDAFRKWAQSLDMAVDDKMLAELNGLSTFEIVDRVALKLGEVSRERLQADYFSLLQDAYRTASPQTGASELLKQLYDRDVKLGLVTSGARELAEPVLARLGWTQYLRFNVFGESGLAGKPAPGPYLRALECLESSAAEVVAVEDSPSGVASAHAAGLRVIGVGTEVAAPRLTAAGAVRVVPDLAACSVVLA